MFTFFQGNSFVVIANVWDPMVCSTVRVVEGILPIFGQKNAHPGTYPQKSRCDNNSSHQKKVKSMRS